MNYQVLQGNYDSTELLPYRIFTTFRNSTLSQRSRRSDFGIVLANVQDVPPEIAILAFDSRSQIRDSQTRSPRQASALDPVVSDLEYGQPLQFCSVLGWLIVPHKSEIGGSGRKSFSDSLAGGNRGGDLEIPGRQSWSWCE